MEGALLPPRKVGVSKLYCPTLLDSMMNECFNDKTCSNKNHLFKKSSSLSEN